MTLVAGADGARLDGTEGWIVAFVGDELRGIRFVERLGEALAEDPGVLAVDVPIGHEDPDGDKRGGRRACDKRARKALGERANSVFATPPLDLLEAKNHQDAVAGADARDVIAPSIQVWNLRNRVIEANALADEDQRVVETHPEVGFREIGRVARGQPADLPSKRSFDGVTERLHLLASVGLEVGPIGEPGRAPPHDVLDAVASAWTARRIANETAFTVPEDPPVDPETGRPVAIHV